MHSVNKSKIATCKLEPSSSYITSYSGRCTPRLFVWLSLYTIHIILATNNNFCHSALLTNIYNRKELSELTDIAHKYLIVPSQGSSNQASSLLIDKSDDVLGSILSQVKEDQNNDEQASGGPRLVSREVGSSGEASEEIPASAALVGLPQLSSRPWKPTEASSQQQRRGLASKLYQQNNGSDASSSGLVETNASTEFPNPNINNLGHEITKILKKFFLHGYDKRVRPNYSGPPALVNVSFHIIGISSVDEVQMDFTTDFYFRQKWYDPRLVFDPVGEIDELCVGAEFAEKIWLPDTFFANEKTATFHKATTENTFIRIANTGRVYRSIRLTVTCSCPMDLQYFPMDRQRCKIEIESYGYNTRDIDYRWERGDESVSLNTKIELPQFKIIGFKMGQELQNLSSGDYIRLYCEIHFVRSMGYYLIQIYIPASLIVMISWVSFWLHRNATPARVALGVTTVLTMTTLMSSTNAALPKISYIKSIDVFLGTCFVMVFASLLEYASVGYIGKRIAMKRKRLQDLQQMQQHHQRVCVAAAASAAAAAAAAAGSSPDTPGTGGTGKDSMFTMPWVDTGEPTASPGVTQTLHRHGTNNGGNQSKTTSSSDTHSKTLGRQARGSRQQNTNSQHVILQNQLQQQPLLQQHQLLTRQNINQTTEFEVSQTHDMIRICGLTPSAIDKHSRVVFPICFVCFNLMYWIIYGHISQQIEDKGPPLIPFMKG